MHKTCNKCGWVYFSVSRLNAEGDITRFNNYYDTLSPEQQENYYGGNKSNIKDYESCWCGNNYKNFRPSKPGDCPPGCTLNPIIHEET